MVGPTWLYAVAAALIFVAAIVVAVVQAGGSEDSPAAVAAGAQQSETAVDGASAQQAAVQQAGAQTAAQQPAPQQQATAPSTPPTAEQDETPADPQPAAEPEEETDPLLGFTMPLAGACVSGQAGHWPGAVRAYRNDGIHEGLDFYSDTACIVVDLATPVLAAKAGTVIRADRDYVDVTPDDWARFEAAGFAGEEILDELRGRQVWIDHGRGIITRYAHLSAIAAPIFAGVRVEAGAVVGFVGESGQRESYAAPGSDLHLHFEIRVGEGWLGEGLEPVAGRALYLAAFGLSEE